MYSYRRKLRQVRTLFIILWPFVCIDNYKAPTRGRTDYFSIKNLTYDKLGGFYLFTVSNSGMLFSHCRLILSEVHP